MSSGLIQKESFTSGDEEDPGSAVQRVLDLQVHATTHAFHSNSGKITNFLLTINVTFYHLLKSPLRKITLEISHLNY